MAADAAFEILYREYYPRVYGLCRRLLNADASAEDATQEVFMRAYRQFKRYDTSRPFWQWIAAISSNYCIDVLRKQSRDEQLFGDEAEELGAVAGQADEPEDNLVNAQRNGSLLNEVEALPDKYRVPVVLAYYKQASYDEISEELAISRNHVGVLLLRAKKMLREALRDMPT